MINQVSVDISALSLAMDQVDLLLKQGTYGLEVDSDQQVLKQRDSYHLMSLFRLFKEYVLGTLFGLVDYQPINSRRVKQIETIMHSHWTVIQSALIKLDKSQPEKVEFLKKNLPKLRKWQDAMSGNFYFEKLSENSLSNSWRINHLFYADSIGWLEGSLIIKRSNMFDDMPISSRTPLSPDPDEMLKKDLCFAAGVQRQLESET